MERPHAIQESDCYVRLPTTERSFMLGIPIKTELLVAPRSSSDMPSLHPLTHSMGSEAYLVRIVALWGRVTKYVNQGGRLSDVSPPWTPESGFAKLNSEIQEWIDGLPYWLRYSSSNLADQVAISQAPSFVFMHIAYHTIICTLHRFSVPSASRAAEPSWDPPPDFVQKNVKTCFQHAKAMSTIMAEVISRSDCIVTAPFFGFAMFTANLFHLHQVFTPCPYVDETPEVARELFATGVTVLNELRIWWGPLEMLYKGIRILWQAKARNARLQIANEATAKAATPAALPLGQLQQEFSGNTPVVSEYTPRPSSQPNSPGRAEHFDTTGLIPLPGGNFGLDFIDPNLHSSINGDSFGDMMFDNIQLEAWTGDRQYLSWGGETPAMYSGALDSNIQPALRDSSKSLAHPLVTHSRPLSPFSNALHGSERSLGRKGEEEKSLVIAKKEVADEHKSVLEQLQREEDSVMPPPNLKPWGLAASAFNATPGLSMNPTSGTSRLAETGTSSPGRFWNTSAKSPDDDKGEEGSEEEEAADLLVYFHARSGGGESNAIDNSIEVPGDEPRLTRTMSDLSGSSPAVVAREMLRKRKRTETDEDFAQVTSNPAAQSENQVDNIGSGNTFLGKSDGTAEKLGKESYVDQARPTGRVDLLNLLQQPPAESS